MTLPIVSTNSVSDR